MAASVEVMSGLEPGAERRLVEAAAALVPSLAARAEEAERLGRLPDETVEELEQSGILGLTTPRAYGGAQASAATLLAVTEQLARGCLSTSFVADVYASVPFLVCLFPDQAQEEVFATRYPKVINTFNPGGGATRTAGGYTLSGRWPFCTGQHHADWAIMSALTTTPDDTIELGFFLTPRSEFRSLDDWQVTGMGATGSATLALDETFVPAHRSLLVSDLLAGRFESTLAETDPYYRIPVLAFALSGMAGVALGGAEALVEAMSDRIQRRGITYTPYLRQAEATVTHLQMAEVTMKLDEVRFHAERVARTADEATEDLDLLTRARCRADTAWALRLGKEIADIVHSASGASAIHRRDPLQRMLRDMNAYSVHSLVLASSNAELFGRVLCGVDPGSPFV